MITQAQKARLLYKLILRLHRGLPEELRVLGTNYARDEFKRHMKCNPQEAKVFIDEWTNYCVSIATQLRNKKIRHNLKFGNELSPEILQHLRDEQVVQLYELMEAAKAPRDKIEQQKR